MQGGASKVNSLIMRHRCGQNPKLVPLYSPYHYLYE
ncbi:hypothetical protein V6Z11_D04G000500 [Gossypium hirsutum]|uniref:Uncharacterized protein n=1 Tax=Gossypium darwinii TaxID=34276 RepID=A0A5D2GSE2_GOSDA|nr:hypothetical protein ES288_A05G465500v1 [Gossypium darwinii]